MDTIGNALLEIVVPCKLLQKKCVVLSYLTQGSGQNSILLHSVVKSLVRAVDILVTCLPALVNGTWRMPGINLHHFHLTDCMMKQVNLTFPVEALQNTSWINEQLRPIQETEIVLNQFSIFAQENLGKQNFTLICLEQGDFLLNGKSVNCQQGSSIFLPETNWELKNEFGSYVHYEYHHLLRNRTLNGGTWNDISDILAVPRFVEPNVTAAPEIENGYFTFVDGQGRLTNQSHFFGYSAICVFLVISVLLCVFNQEVKSCCAFMCRKKKYVPEVAYNVETDDVTVIEKTEPASKLVRLNISDVFENHSDSEGLGTFDPLTLESSWAHLQPEKVKIKRTAPTPSQPKLQPGISSRLARTDMALGPSAALALKAETQPKLKVQQCNSQLMASENSQG